MSRWLPMVLLLIAAVAAAIRFLGPQEDTLPEDCRVAVEALEGGDFDLSVDRFLLCLDDESLAEPVVAQVYAGLGLAYAGKGDHFQAIRDYSEALRRNPDLDWTYNNRCWSYGLVRNAEKALADCNEAVRRLPNERAVLDSRALAYWLGGETGKARADLERARQLEPTAPTWQERFQQFEAMF